MSFFGTCTSCGRTTRVSRHELDHARQPHCPGCGGPLELSEEARRKLADAQAAKSTRRRTARGREPAPEVERILPEREAKRYEFWDHPDLWHVALRSAEEQGGPDFMRRVRDRGPVDYYETRAEETIADYQRDAAKVKKLREERKLQDAAYASAMIVHAECEMYRNGRPYFKVWPSIIRSLCHTDMLVDGAHFRTPYSGFLVRFPKGADNPLDPVGAVVVCAAPEVMVAHHDQRDWSLVMAWAMPAGTTRGSIYALDVPVKAGRTMEDSLSQWRLEHEMPDPGLADLARRIMRVIVGTCFFAVDRHELILPEVTRKVIDRHRFRKEPLTAEETREALAQAREHDLYGFKVGSEITLPSAEVRTHEGDGTGEPREGHALTHGHVRRGFIRLQACGEGMQDRRPTFIWPTLVRPDLPMGGKGYKIKLT